MINFWLREQDKSLIEKLCDTNLNCYAGGILTGSLNNPGFLGKINKHFVLGKEGVWIPEGTKHKYHFVRIDNSSAYGNGLILTPYSGIEIDYHLRTQRIDETTKFERVELEGMDVEDFVERVFRTYYSKSVCRFDERDQHFLLYSTYSP